MTQARRRSPTPVLGPWALADMVALSINTAVGMLLIGVAWDRTSGLVGVRDQVPWLNVAIGGVVIIAAGNTAWFLRGRRAVGQRRSGTLPTARGGMRVRGACAQASVVPSQYLDQAAESGTDFVAARTIFVAARIMTHYHRPECAFAVGKTVTGADRSTHERAGRRPCGICCQ
jgi:hypothetical protein